MEGYGVEMGLLIDLARSRGTAGIVQVDLETRHHRNRSLQELSPQAAAIMQTVLRRVDRRLAPVVTHLVQEAGTTEIEAAERPPMLEVAEYLQRHSPAPIGA